MAILALDIGGTNTRCSVFRRSGQMVTHERVPNAQLGQPFVVEHLTEFIDRQITAAVHAGESIDAIGLAVAAVVDAATGFVIVGENIGWRAVPLGDLLRARFKLPVAVDTDAFCGGLAEARLGAGREWQSFLYVTIGTGIGHAVILKREIWHGTQNAANVFGHLQVVPGGIACYCGGRGCLCMYASGEGLTQLGRHHHPELKGLSARDIVQAAEDWEAWAVGIIEQALDKLALALSHAYNLLDIDGVVLDGGAVSIAYPDLIELAHRTNSLVYPRMRPVALRRGELHGSSVLQGAALMALDL